MILPAMSIKNMTNASSLEIFIDLSVGRVLKSP